MTTFPNSPKLFKGGLVLLDPMTGVVPRIISLQYNSDTLSRTLQVQGMGEVGNCSQAIRFKRPAVETIKLEVEIDATDQLEFPEEEPNRVATRGREKGDRILLQSQEVLLGGDRRSYGFIRDE